MVLFGTNLYPATGDAAGRQERAAAALLAVSPVPPINLQFVNDPKRFEIEGFVTRPILRQTSQQITGNSGARKPIVTEVFTCLATAALERGISRFGYMNSDIIVTSEALDRVHRADTLSLIFSRGDFTPGKEHELQPMIYGTDVFVIDAAWWLSHQRRFRPYIIGESCWDNVFTAQLLCWTNGLLLNREPLVRHEWHAAAWNKSPFSLYNGYLAGLDRMYFTQWVRYVHELEQLRAAAGGLADEDSELQLQNRIFHSWRPGFGNRIVQALRSTKLRTRRWAAAAFPSQALRVNS